MPGDDRAASPCVVLRFDDPHHPPRMGSAAFAARGTAGGNVAAQPVRQVGGGRTARGRGDRPFPPGYRREARHILGNGCSSKLWGSKSHSCGELHSNFAFRTTAQGSSGPRAKELRRQRKGHDHGKRTDRSGSAGSTEAPYPADSSGLCGLCESPAWLVLLVGQLRSGRS